MSAGLKPCPFCGGRAEMRPKSGYRCERSGSWVDPKPFCSVCRATAPDRVSIHEPTAVERWNTRVEPDEPSDPMTSLQSAVAGLERVGIDTSNLVPKAEAIWPIGCIKRSACARHKACVYGNFGSCTHATRSIAEDVEKASEGGR